MLQGLEGRDYYVSIVHVNEDTLLKFIKHIDLKKSTIYCRNKEDLELLSYFNFKQAFCNDFAKTLAMDSYKVYSRERNNLVIVSGLMFNQLPDVVEFLQNATDIDLTNGTLTLLLTDLVYTGTDPSNEFRSMSRFEALFKMFGFAVIKKVENYEINDPNSDSNYSKTFWCLDLQERIDVTEEECLAFLAVPQVIQYDDDLALASKQDFLESSKKLKGPSLKKGRQTNPVAYNNNQA